MTFEELKEKALTLPYAPGVYIMRDKTDTVIYVGKAKKLKNSPVCRPGSFSLFAHAVE